MLLYELDKIELKILEQLESEDGIDQEIYGAIFDCKVSKNAKFLHRQNK